jgi:hypothetical protein
LKIPKGAIRIRISKKNRQHNGQKKKYKRTNNDLQKHTYKTKDRVTRTPLKTGGERRCSGRVSSSCSGLLLTRKLLNQGFLLVMLKSSIRQFYDRHHDLDDRYGISVPQTTTQENPKQEIWLRLPMSDNLF